METMGGIVVVWLPAVAPVTLEPGRIWLPMRSGWLTKSSAGPATTIVELVAPFVLDGEFTVMNTYMGPVTFAGTMQRSTGW